MIKNKKDFGLGVVSVLIAAGITYMSLQLRSSPYVGDPGPRMFPLIGAVIMFICGVALIIRPEKESKAFLTPKQWKSAFAIFGVYVAATVLLYLLGFAVTVPITFFVLTFMMSKLSLKEATPKIRLIKSLIYAILAGAGVYVVYVVLLDAVLPKGLLFTL
jgi:hypothetical protein